MKCKSRGVQEFLISTLHFYYNDNDQKQIFSTCQSFQSYIKRFLLSSSLGIVSEGEQWQPPDLNLKN